MENKSVNSNLLIAKKQNAEIYKDEIEKLEKEIKETQQKIGLTMFEKEKELLNQEKIEKEEQIKNLKSTYDSKKENIENEINGVKEKLSQQIEEIESKLISREEYNKLKEEKSNKEAELSVCERDIQEVKDELKTLIDKDGGYEQDTVSLSKKLDNLTAYKAYINEEMNEIDTKLEDAIVIEDSMKEIKYIEYMKMRLGDLSYDSIEKWAEDEKKFQEEVIEKEPEPTEPETIKLEPTEPETIKPEPIKPEPIKPEPIKPEPIKPEPIKPEPIKPEPIKPKPIKPEPIKWHKKLTQEQIEELIAEGLKPGDNEYDEYLWNHGINPFGDKKEKLEPKPELIDIYSNSKRNWFKKMIDSIKRKILSITNRVKKIPEKANEIKINENWKIVGSDSSEKNKKERYQPKHSKPRNNIISKSKSLAISLGKETIGGVKIAGTRLIGHLKGENKHTTNMKVNNIRQQYFYGSVDHTKAQQDASRKVKQPEKSEELTK